MTKRRSKADHSISACILARNEEHRIEDALKSLLGWTDQIIVIDNESNDATVAVASKYTDIILTAPRMANFDSLRSLALPHASGAWMFNLDADERVPARLGEALKRLVLERGHEFEALMIPFKHFFCGKWMEHCNWWPGYTRPQLLKKGCFTYHTALHKGVQVDGRTIFFPADDPDLAIVHYSYDDIRHYLEKLNNYTDGEAENLLKDNEDYSWRAHLSQLVHDWQVYYDRGQGHLDGMQGFELSMLSAFYRFISRAKLWDHHRKSGDDRKEPLPRTVREMLDFMVQIAGGAPAQSRALAQSARVPLLWCAPLFDPSGYADEARNFILSLVEAGEPVSVSPMIWSQEDAFLSPEVRATIDQRTLPASTPADLFVSQTTPPLNRPSPNARFNITRTMFETDRLQPGWEQILNRMDRIWVPSEFNRETFVRSGVDPEKIAVIPGAIDPQPFMTRVEPWPVPGDEAFKFLTVFDWTMHKGWDILLEAFVREFGNDSAVGLIMKVWSSNNYTLEDIRSQADAHLEKQLDLKLESLPNIHLWQERIPTADMPRLYQAVNAFVLPTRGEGWCRPLMEAMASGLPTLATAWSGLTEFHNARVGYPVKYRLMPVTEAGAQEIPIYRGHYWAEPDMDHLRRTMRSVVKDRASATKKGEAAQKHIAKYYSRSAVSAILKQEISHCRKLAEQKPIPAPGQDLTRNPPPISPKAHPMPVDPVPDVDFRELLGRPLRVRWEGDQEIISSLALVNRELCAGLLARDDIELTLARGGSDPTFVKRVPSRLKALLRRRDAELSGPPDVTIRHHFPPNWERPPSGKLIVMQPWEYGHIPLDWVQGAQAADEVWAYSRFVREVYARSGVPAEKIRIVPLGVRTAAFRPGGPKYSLETTKSLRFLFVGGAIARKGADLLLQAYQQAFTKDDDVCLIVKDMGTETFYRGQTLAEQLRAAQSDPNSPEVIYLDNEMSEPELASLYRACTCVVLPYRGEGFGLSPLEGMACGLPAIVTAGGPTDDYLDETMALRVPFTRRFLEHNRVGTMECAGDPWNLEPDLNALVDAMRWVRDHPAELHERAEKGLAQIRKGWTWDRSVSIVRERVASIVVPAKPTKLSAAVSWAPKPAKEAATHKPRPAPTRRARRRPISLSLCMIVRDEEPRIASCLKSIAPYVDEMVVVDTGSSDRTREVARDCGALVFDFPWVNDFAAARNQSLDMARGDWAYWMDADDVISPECGRQLRELTKRHPDKNAAYKVQVCIPPGPGQFHPTVIDHVKLFPNRPGLRFEHRIHEQILPSLRRAAIPVCESSVYVTHQHYDRSEEGQTKKRLRDFRLLYLDLADKPNHPFALFNLGMTHLQAIKEFEVAAHYLRRSLDGSDSRDSIVDKAYALLTTARICQLDWNGAIQANEEGRSHYPDDPELLFQAGQVYQQVGRFEEARQALERLTDGNADTPQGLDSGQRTYRGRHELALLFRRMGDSEHCERVLREIVGAQPNYTPAMLDLVETMSLMGKRNDAQALLASIPRTPALAERLAMLERLVGIEYPSQ